MSFSASWKPGDERTAEGASLSPPLESMGEDVRAAVEETAKAVEAIERAIGAQGDAFSSTVSGHVSQSEGDGAYASVSISRVA